MSAHMKKRHIKRKANTLCMRHAGKVYYFPKKIAEKYCVINDIVDSDTVFKDLNEKYTKPGALLHGLRIRENSTQAEMAKKIKVTQSDISQMETGVRRIGRTVAQRIEKLFDIDYRLFLE